MKKYLYHIECVTNLHVGSGDANYNIVDKEVEKDPITGFPIIHASGIKGALRAVYKPQGDDARSAEELFGAPSTRDGSDNAGKIIFTNAQFISRPMRVNGDIPYISTSCLGAVKDYITLTTAFGLNDPNLSVPDNINFGTNAFLLSTNITASVEGDRTGALANAIKQQLSPLLGSCFALAKSFDNYALPVIARNNLQTEKGNLWYEEYVPYHSRFYLVVLVLDDTIDINTVIPKNSVVQVGGNASVGYGYCRFSQIPEITEGTQSE